MVLYLLRFGELWLKSEPVKRRFIDTLARNLREHLSAEDIKSVKLTKERGRLFLSVETPVDDILARVFGITSFSVVEKGTLENMESLVVEAGKTLAKSDRFAVRVHRIGTHDFSSKDMEIRLGSLIVKTYGNKVDLTKPDKTISVEIRERQCYVFTDAKEGAGGLPLGTEGEVLAEFDGSEEAVVAAFLIMRRGCKTILVGRGDTSVLKGYDPSIELLSEFPQKHKAKALVSFESFADAEEMHKQGLFVLRPLVGLSKKEIHELFKKIS